MSFMNKDIAVDLGTSNIKIYMKDKGVIVKEASVVVLNSKSNEVLAVGDDAKEMIGKTPDNLVVIKPIKNGVVSNFNGACKLLQKFFSELLGKSLFSRVRVLVGVPSSITDVEQRAVEETMYLAGAKEVFTVNQAFAAAIGSGIKVDTPEGKMVISIGAGVTEVAVISLGGIVSSNSIKLAGDDMDKQIIEYIKNKYNILIGENIAEDIKNNVGTAGLTMTDERLQLRGRNVLTGLPDQVTIYTQDVQEAIKDILKEIVKLVNITLEKTPPELAGDIVKNGIVICGGGAYIKNIERYINNETGLQANIANNPMDAVIKGLGKMLNNLEVLKKAVKR